MESLLFFWVLWIVVSWPLAIRKNRSVLNWVLLTLLFGVFATIVLAILPKLDNEKK